MAGNQSGLGHPGNWPGKNKDGLLAQIMWTLAVANLDNIFYVLDFACGAKCHGIPAHCCTSMFYLISDGENLAQGGDPKYSRENIAAEVWR